MAKKRVKMPDYLTKYQPGDTIPTKLWERATQTCCTKYQGGFGPWLVSDAIHFRLKPEKGQDNGKV